MQESAIPPANNPALQEQTFWQIFIPNRQKTMQFFSADFLSRQHPSGLM